MNRKQKVYKTAFLIIFSLKKRFAFVHFCMFVGQLIISKVFLGRSAAVKEGLPIDCDHYPKANSVYHSTSSKEQKHIAQTAPGELECVNPSEKNVFRVVVIKAVMCVCACVFLLIRHAVSLQPAGQL